MPMSPFPVAFLIKTPLETVQQELKKKNNLSKYKV